MFAKQAFRHINLLHAPLLTLGHRWIGAAALLGTLWVFFHLATVVITILSDGTHWVLMLGCWTLWVSLRGSFLLFNVGNHQIERLTNFGT